MGKFEIARRVLGALAVIGWGVIALSALALTVYLFDAPNETSVLIVVIAAGLIAVFGFIIIAVAQMGLAQIATAENTEGMLKIMKAQLGTPETQVANTKTRPSSAPAPNSGKTAVGSIIRTYKNYEIIKIGSGFSIEGKEFSDIFAAQKWIERNPKS
jgi:hypothetical protein